jgi:hypothetical protein
MPMMRGSNPTIVAPQNFPTMGCPSSLARERFIRRMAAAPSVICEAFPPVVALVQRISSVFRRILTRAESPGPSPESTRRKGFTTAGETATRLLALT